MHHNIEHRLKGIEQSQERILCKLDVISGKEDTLMALADDLKAGIAALDAETTKIGTRIDTLLAQAQNSSLSDQEKADVFAALAAETARLRVLGTDPNVLVPPVSPALAAMRAKKP